MRLLGIENLGSCRRYVPAEAPRAWVGSISGVEADSLSCVWKGRLALRKMRYCWSDSLVRTFCLSSVSCRYTIEAPLIGGDPYPMRRKRDDSSQMDRDSYDTGVHRLHYGSKGYSPQQNQMRLPSTLSRLMIGPIFTSRGATTPLLEHRLT